MKTEPEIATLVAAFNSAHTEERALWSVRCDHELDVRVAERAKDAEAKDAAAKAQQEAASTWVKALRVREAAAKDLCAALGIDPAAMKSSL